MKRSSELVLSKTQFPALEVIRNDLRKYNDDNNCMHFEQPFYQDNHQITLFFCLSDNKFLEKFQKFTMKGYSFLGLAAVCINAIEHPKEPTFAEKKEFIQELIKLNFKPTEEDIKLAILEREERRKPILQNIRLIYCAKSNIFSPEMPQELIDYISLLMLETEKSLL